MCEALRVIQSEFSDEAAIVRWLHNVLLHGHGKKHLHQGRWDGEFDGILMKMVGRRGEGTKQMSESVIQQKFGGFVHCN